MRLLHHKKTMYNTYTESRIRGLCEDFEFEIPGRKPIGNAVENGALSSRALMLRSITADTLLLPMPQVYTCYLLNLSAQLGYMAFHAMHCYEQEKPFGAEFIGTKIERDAPEATYTLFEWLDAASANALVRNTQALEEIAQVTTERLGLYFDAPLRQVHNTYYPVFQLFFSGEQDKTKQVQVLEAVRAIGEPGVINAIVEREMENRTHSLFTPLVDIIEAIWQQGHAKVEQAVLAAMEKNYHYFAYLDDPNNGVGDNALSLNNTNAMFLDKINGILALYYDRTGKTMSFDSPYLIDWLIKGEGPDREDVLANPPSFDEQELLKRIE